MDMLLSVKRDVIDSVIQSMVKLYSQGSFIQAGRLARQLPSDFVLAMQLLSK